MADINPVENPLGALQQMALQRAQSNQTALDAKRAEYDTAMGKFEELANAPTPEAARWGAMAKAAAQVPPMVGGFGALLANIGGAYGQQVAQDEQQNFLRQQTLMKLKEDYLKKLEDQQTKLISGATGRGAVQGFEFRKNSDGTTSAYSKATGLPIGTYGPQDIGKIASLTQTLAKAAFERGEYTTLDEALNWAQGEAMRRIGQMEVSKGNRTAPLQGDVGGLPTTPPKETPAPTTASTFPRADDTEESLNTRLQIIQEEMQRYGDNPEVMNALRQTERGIRNRLFDLRQKTAAAPAAPAPTSQAPSALPKKDVQSEEFKKSYGGEEGKAYAKKYEDIVATGQAAGTLEGKLNLMERLTLEHGDNIPEGKAAGFIADLKSTAKSFGVNLKGTGVTDVISSLGTEGALKARTADGQNLLPGSMSNYEDQLLQKVFPSLSFTKEGRLLQIQIAKAQLKMRQDLALAAQEYRTNTGALDPKFDKVSEAYARANPFLNPDRIAALEEYAARLAKGKK